MEVYLTFPPHTPSSPLSHLNLFPLSLLLPSSPQTSSRKWIKVRTAKQKEKINLLLPLINYEISLSGGEKHYLVSCLWGPEGIPLPGGNLITCHVISICALFISGLKLFFFLIFFIAALISCGARTQLLGFSFPLISKETFCMLVFLLDIKHTGQRHGSNITQLNMWIYRQQ